MSAAKYFFLTLCFSCAALRQVQAFSIVLDYTYATNSAFFTEQTKATLEKAASDISAVLANQSLSPVSPSYSGTYETTTANISSWHLDFNNPSTGVAVNISNASLAADVFTVYVGSRVIGGSAIGMGGSVAMGYSGGYSYTGTPNPDEAYAAAIGAFNADANRTGTGPISGSFSSGVEYGLFGGALYFDDNRLNWHTDFSTPVTSGYNDLYSVALHEILHTLNFGLGSTWDQLATTDPLLTPGSGHLPYDSMSTTLDNTPQEAVMDPNIITGTRKYLTNIDVAYLEKLGFDVSAVPEPASAVLLGLAGMSFLVRRKK